jgi:3-oxoacyl-[acyl-carrier protein] reductase
LNPGSPDDRVVLVTGTSKGLGRHLVEHYAGLGYRVIGCSRGPAGPEIDGYKHFQVDVADEAQVSSLFREVRRDFGRLDVLVNNAGVASMNHFLLTPLASVEKVFRTNVFGAFVVMREAARLMRRNGFGRIVNLVTVGVPLRLEGEAAYVASKSAVMSLTQVAAKELAPFGITVNAVGPGPIQTDLMKGVPENMSTALIDRLVLKRWTEFGDVTNVIDFFISSASSAVTGQTIFLGGA